MTKKRLILIISSVLAIFVIGGAVLGYFVWQSALKVQEQEQASKQPKITQYDNRQQLVEDVNKKYGSRDYAGAIKEIEGQKSAAEDVGLQLLLAGAYANSGDLKKAFEIYKRLDGAGKLSGQEYVNMAGMAERAGDVSAAIDAYKKAKEYAISSKTESQDQITVYDYKIAELEKKR